MRLSLILLLGALSGELAALGQKVNQFSVQAGYLYSTSTFTWTSTALIFIPNADPKSGFYAGLTYAHPVSTLLTSQLEFTYQQKGYKSQNLLPDKPSTFTFSYMAVTPMIGIRPIKNLRFLVGPELNFLLNRTLGRVNGTEDKLIEFGLMGRSSYQLNRVGLAIGYFRGLTAYHQSDFHYLTNQNWQLGLFYQLSKR